jgi:hypothetical protein
MHFTENDCHLALLKKTYIRLKYTGLYFNNTTSARSLHIT